MSRRVDVSILQHQAAAFRHITSGKPSTTCLVWGRGLGKSFFARLLMWLLVATWFGKQRRTKDGVITGIRIYVVMPTLKQFKQVHGKLLADENEKKWKFLGGKLDRTEWSITFPDGSFIIPVPGEIATSERGRGFRGDAVFIDEADDVDPAVRDAVIQPWFSEPWSLGIEVDMGTPKRGRYGLLWKMFQFGKSDDPEFAAYRSFHARSEECPEVVSPEHIRKAKNELPPAVFDREYGADFDSAEGLVYAFNEDFHVRNPPDTRMFTRFFVCGDHGTVDPGVILFCGIQGHGSDSVLWVLDEVYASNKPNHEWDAIARERFSGLDGYFDPSRPDRIIDYRRAGIRCRDTDNSIEPGVARVADLLVIRYPEHGEPWARLYISPQCANTIWEFSNYRRKKDPRNPDSYLEDIVDKNNHAMDSLRYGCMGEFGPLPSRGNYRHEGDQR